MARRQKPVRRLGALLLLALMGCTTLRPVPQPQSFIQQERPSEIWVTHGANSTEVPLLTPRVYLDSVYGHSRMGDQVWYALDDVRQVRSRQFSMARSSLLFAGIATVLVAALFSLSGGGPSEFIEQQPNQPDLRRQAPWPNR